MPAAPVRSRRAFLFGRQAAKQPLRPPWALDESDFLDRCTDCGACVARCPEHVLTRGEGGYPVFDPHLGECTFCGECELACEPAALSREADAAPWELLAEAGDACLPRHGVVCSSCRDVCPEQAITFLVMTAVPAPAVDAARCTGCGACVGICPVAAISLHHPARETA
ncbi:ferredoxin-type protein NapF [Lysobacter niastensis]|uniref:Ferredoxin-type protein NapF n=1 Tax=Lysobacter niastensis TaxID=380629 RepID=A0ABS0B1V7_9GAMM|nr:ferredoxin-type protein NapF [Lysobacter niastensis]MBF6022471.1 ferredoxin-type protein NapF [Lysobacter niastensis]